MASAYLTPFHGMQVALAVNAVEVIGMLLERMAA